MVKTPLPQLVLVAGLLVTSLAWAQNAPEQPPADSLAAYERDLAAAVEKHGALATPAARVNLPLAQLALKKARLVGRVSAMWGGVPPATQFLSEGREALRRLTDNEPARVKLGALNELAYITANDRTVQPYYLYLPRNYTPDKKWPLIVFLHGYVPSISVLDPWVLPGEICDIAGDNGCMLLIPYGRRNTDFQGVGEEDVLASLREVQKLFPVDADRLYLSGCSMGGMGVWNIALRRPGLFAAVTPLCGHTDMFIWCRWPREETVPWKRWLVEWDNAVDQAASAYNQRIFAQHGELDNLVPSEQSRLMVKAAEAVGAPIRYFEWPGGSHFIYLEREPYEKAWSWQAQFKREPSPRTVKFKCYSLNYNQAYWLGILDFEKWGVPAEVTAEVAADGQALKLTTTNARQLFVYTTTAGLPDKPFPVTWNGKSLTAQPEKGICELELTPLSATAGLRKRPGMCGPCEEAFDGPFIVVQGTAGDQAADEDLARKVAQWAKEWDDFADGAPVVKTDAELTPEELRSNSLICFGTPATNSVLARVADKLPLTIGDHRYVVNGKEYAGADLGLVMCYPNPLGAGYVLVYAGEYYGEQLSINHKHDLLPDFLVFTTKDFGRDQANEPVCAGFFDMAWKLDEKLTWGK